jgi:hypothetical protein
MPEMTLDLGVLALVGNIFLWAVSGWLLVRRVFRLKGRERLLAGFAVGLVMQNFLANLLAQAVDFPSAVWIASTLMAFVSLVWARPDDWRGLLAELKPALPQFLILFILTGLFMLTGRGLALFDDYQNLPVTSLLATGEIPPRFALDPSLRFGYHYFLLLEAAQFVRIGQVYPWNALDLVRSLILALTMVLAGLWAWRLTRSRIAAALTGFFVAFAGGTRWLLLLLPKSLLEKISEQVTLMGTGAQTAPTLFEALTRPWVLEGAGPFPYPFAFVNGVNPPLVMALGGFGALPVLLLALLLLTGSRWRHWAGGILVTILFSSLALTNEVLFGLLVGGALIVLVISLIVRRRWAESLWPWVTVAAAAGGLSLVQGGILTDMARGWFGSETQSASYFDVKFALLWPPEMISSHLGRLSLGSLPQLLTALFEAGPLVLLLPLIFGLGLRHLRRRNWLEAVVIGSAAMSLIALAIYYSGELGLSATTRLYAGMFHVAALFAVPLGWLWLAKRGDGLRAGVSLAGAVTALGGLVLFSLSLIAAPKPVYSYFITDMDVVMFKEHWNKLEPSARIFDPEAVRSVTVFGRYTRAYDSWYVPKAEWEALAAAPDLANLAAAGFDYVYFGGEYLESLTPGYRALLENTCATVVDEVFGFRSPTDFRKDFRRLLDLRGCR